MRKSNIAGIIVAGVVGAVVAFVILLLLIKLLWAWTIPDLFPGAVEQGLVAATISWATAGKIAILMAVFSGMASGHHARTTD
jgi:hypothetical protein